MKRSGKFLFKIIFIFFIITNVTTLFAYAETNTKKQSKKFKGVFVEVLNTGHSDSIYIELPSGENVLIDGGEFSYGDYVVDYLKTRNLKKEDGVPVIDYVVNTHPHSDHMGGLVKVFENFKIKNFYYPYDIEMKRYEGFEGSESIENEGYKINCMNYCYQFYEKVLKLASEKNVKIHDTIPGSYIDSKNILKFVHPDKVYKQNRLDKPQDQITGWDYDVFNSDSAAILVSYNNFNMFLAGDINKETEEDILNLGLLDKKKIDILKVAHHGIDTSTSREFIEATKPSYAIITRTVAMDDSPDCIETNNLLKEYNVTKLETWMGNIRVYVTDNEWKVEY